MSRKPRTLLERAESIFRLVDYYGEPIAKSRFQEVGISPREIDQWLMLIKLIQAKPMLETQIRGSRTYVDSSESKFMLLMKKKFLDQDASYGEREGAIKLYFKALAALERIKGQDVELEDIIHELDRSEIDRPTIVRMAEDAITEIREDLG